MHFPLQNDKSSTPGLKSNTPTPRNDAPTPGTSTTPGLRSMPGKPAGMDPIGIMGRHTGVVSCWRERVRAPGCVGEERTSLTGIYEGGGACGINQRKGVEDRPQTTF